MQVISAQVRKNIRSAAAPLAKNAGFTLVEIMVVVVIVGLVAVAAAPQYSKVVDRMTYDAAYADLRLAVGRCRGEAMASAYPVTVPTTLTFFTNGYACVAWWDKNNDRALGTSGAAVAGDLDDNGLGGEIRDVFFQKRFDESLEFSDGNGLVYIDLATSALPTGGSAPSGKSIVIAPGGFLMAPDRSAYLNASAPGSPAGVHLKKRERVGGAPLEEYSVMRIYTSGQVQ